jgi:hypothetical protein
MTFYEKAWKERVRNEDKAMYEHTVAMKEALKRTGTPSLSGSSVRASSIAHSQGLPPAGPAKAQPTAELLKEYHANYVSPSVGTSLVPQRGSALPSVAGSVRSSATTSQLSHKGVSTAAGSTRVSGASAYDRRIEALESSLAAERASREKVQNELAEIKQLLLDQRKVAVTNRRAAYRRPS